MSSGALASVKRALGTFSSAECRLLAEQALQSESGQHVRRRVAQAFLEMQLNLLVPPNLRETLQVEMA